MSTTKLSQIKLDSTSYIPERNELGVRWVVLFLSTIAMIANYYSFDIPAGIHQQLRDYSGLGQDEFELYFNRLYSVYSLPNILLTLVGGPLVDWFGAPSLCMFYFSIVMLIGQLVFSIGVSFNDWGVMLTGRFIYGLAGDNIAIAKTALITLYFAGGEISFAFGCALTIGRVGGVLGNFIAPKMANDWGVPNAIWFGTFINVVGTVGCFVLYLIDRHTTMKYDYSTEESDASSQSDTSNSSTNITSPLKRDKKPEMEMEKDPYDNKEPENILEDKAKTMKKSKARLPRASDIKKFDSVYWLLTVSFVVVSGVVIPFNNIASGLLLERDLFKEPPSSCQVLQPERCTEGTLAPPGGNPAVDIYTGGSCPGENYAPAIPQLINITNTNSSDWEEDSYIFRNLTMADIRCTDSFWQDACTQNYCDKQDDATELAGVIMSIPYTISAVFAIPLGFYVDQYGQRAYIATIGFSTLFVSHVILAHVDISAIIPLIGQGIAHSCYGGILWPSLQLVVDPALLGTAYGVMLSIQNGFLSLIPLFVAFLYQEGNSQYIPNTEILFYSLGAAGVVTGILLIIEDERTGRRLHRSHKRNPDTDFVASLMPGEKLTDETVEDYIGDAFT